MSNYTPTGKPQEGTRLLSKDIRDEYTLIQTAVNSKADLASPALTGTPTAPTASTGTNTTQIATTAFVSATAMAAALPSQTGNSGNFITTDGSSASWTPVINEKRGADIASASTLNLDNVTGNFVNVTGTTPITGITLSEGRGRLVRFDAALTLTHGASLVLPGTSNITTSSGDYAEFRGLSGGSVKCVAYHKADGKSVIPSPRGWAWLSTVSASASSTVDLETTFNSTYDVYVIAANSIVMSNDGAGIFCRFKVGGAYDTSTNYRYHLTGVKSSAGTYASTNHSTQTYIHVASDIGNGAGKSASFMMRVHKPSSTSLMKTCDWEGVNVISTGNDVSSARGMGVNISTTALTGVRFYPSAGTITSGDFRLYGIVKS